MQKFQAAAFVLLLVMPFVASQSMVLIGGGLDAENDIVYGKIVELAVIISF